MVSTDKKSCPIGVELFILELVEDLKTFLSFIFGNIIIVLHLYIVVFIVLNSLLFAKTYLHELNVCYYFCRVFFFLF